MKKALFAILRVLSVPVMYLVAFALQFWWLYLILLACGAYQTAAKEWGWIAGIVSLLMAFVLPVTTFVLWCMAFDKEPSEVRKCGARSRKSAEGDGQGRMGGASGLNQQSYLELLAALMAKMAKADGHIDVVEIRVAEHAFDRLGFNDEQRQVCVDSFRKALKESWGAEHYALRMTSLGFGYEMRLLVYEVLWDIADADGFLAPEEKVMLAGLERSLSLAPGTFDRYFRRYVRSGNANGYWHGQGHKAESCRDDLSDAYDELGCRPTSSDDELKASYRNLAKKLHPDVLRAQGLPESLMGRANERMARINAAWDRIKKARHISG